MADAHAGLEHQIEHDEHTHPGYKTYILVGVVLTVLTAAEVSVFYIPALAAIMVPLLLVLMAGKFALVVMFYMHLKPDDNLFTASFFTPMVLAVTMVISLIILFQVLPQYAPFHYVFS